MKLRRSLQTAEYFVFYSVNKSYWSEGYELLIE